MCVFYIRILVLTLFLLLFCNSIVQVSCIRMLSGERVLTASHDGTVKMWDVRTDTCVATVGRSSSAVLCMEYDDSTGILAAAGRDVYVNLVEMHSY